MFEVRRDAKLALLDRAIASRQGCKVTDENGRTIKILRRSGDQLIDGEGRSWLWDQVALPLMTDPDLVECLDLLIAGADVVSKHAEFVAADVFPVLKIWDDLLCKAERKSIHPKLSPQQKQFWKQMREQRDGS